MTDILDDTKELRFQRHISENERTLRNHAFRLTRNEAEADDLLQETFIKIWNNFDKYNNSKSFKSWSLAVMTNLFNDTLRNNCKSFHKKIASFDAPSITALSRADDGDAFIDYIEDKGPNVLDEMITKEELKKAEDLINSIDQPLSSQILKLSLIDGIKPKEIADMLNIKGGFCRHRLMRANIKFKQKYLEQLN